MDAQTLFIHILSLHIHSQHFIPHCSIFSINHPRQSSFTHIEACYYETLDWLSYFFKQACNDNIKMKHKIEAYSVKVIMRKWPLKCINILSSTISTNRSGFFQVDNGRIFIKMHFGHLWWTDNILSFKLIQKRSWISKNYLIIPVSSCKRLFFMITGV